MNEKVTEAGAEYLYDTTLKTLITDGAGAIAGARFAGNKDRYAIVDIKAKAVDAGRRRLHRPTRNG